MRWGVGDGVEARSWYFCATLRPEEWHCACMGVCVTVSLTVAGVAHGLWTVLDVCGAVS